MPTTLTTSSTRLLPSLLAAAVAGLSIAGCGTPSAAAETGASAEAHAHHPAAPGPAATDAAGAASGHSLYRFASTWVDQSGDTLALADLGGRVRVVAMVYTSCGFACPRILARMKRMEGELAAAHGDDVGFVLVSVDPERDTPGKLARFAEASRLDPERWTLLNGSEDDVLALSVLLGVKVQPLGDGEFAHSNVITVLDRGGVPVGRAEGLDSDLDPALAAVREALGA